MSKVAVSCVSTLSDSEALNRVGNSPCILCGVCTCRIVIVHSEFELTVRMIYTIHEYV